MPLRLIKILVFFRQVLGQYGATFRTQSSPRCRGSRGLTVLNSNMITIEELFTASKLGYAATVRYSSRGRPRQRHRQQGQHPAAQGRLRGRRHRGGAPPPWRRCQCHHYRWQHPLHSAAKGSHRHRGGTRGRRCQCRHYRWQHPAAPSRLEGRTFTVKVLLRGRLRHHHQQGRPLDIAKGEEVKKLLREAAMEN